jgi:hypothetical protein
MKQKPLFAWLQRHRSIGQASGHFVGLGALPLTSFLTQSRKTPGAKRIEAFQSEGLVSSWIFPDLEFHGHFQILLP